MEALPIHDTTPSRWERFTDTELMVLERALQAYVPHSLNEVRPPPPSRRPGPRVRRRCAPRFDRPPAAVGPGAQAGAATPSSPVSAATPGAPSRCSLGRDRHRPRLPSRVGPGPTRCTWWRAAGSASNEGSGPAPWGRPSSPAQHVRHSSGPGGPESLAPTRRRRGPACGPTTRARSPSPPTRMRAWRGARGAHTRSRSLITGSDSLITFGVSPAFWAPATVDFPSRCSGDGSG
jgi:hypothetical protein